MNAVNQLQLFQYEETLQNLKRQLDTYEAELSASWQSQEMIPLRAAIQQLQQQLQLCSKLCQDITSSNPFVY